MLAFVPNSLSAEVERPIVRVIYFIPNDVQPQPNIDEQIDTQVKRVKTLFADLMEAHGFKRKSFIFEETAGKVVVHHRQGTRNDKYYQKNPNSVWYEFPIASDPLKDYYLVYLDIDAESPDNTLCGLGYNATAYKGGLFPASGTCSEGEYGDNFIAHELAHGFGLAHDDRSDSDAQRIYLYSIDRMITAYCAAAWFDNHPAFNEGTIQRNYNTNVRMLEPRLASPPNTIRLQFEITDPDGIQIVKLITPHRSGDYKLRDCKEVNSATETTVEFVTNQLPYYTNNIILRMLDRSGNYIEKNFTLTDPLPFSPEKALRIPDPNLAAAIRSQTGGPITTYTIADVTHINANRKEIKDLTGLEHAQNLMHLSLFVNEISNITALTKCTQLHWLVIGYNRISDFTPLSKLVHLRMLELSSTGIKDFSILKDLIHLDYLALNANGISDVSQLAAHKRLKNLFLEYNNISDISPLSALTQLAGLYITDNAISDLSPLSKLTQLRILDLDNNNINDVNPLAELVNLNKLYLIGNPIQNIEPLFDLLRRNPSIKIFLYDRSNVLQLPTTDPPNDRNNVLHLPTTDLPRVVFSEFMFEAGGGNTALPQWIEVYNSGNSAVNLRGWKLRWKRLKPSLLEATATFDTDFHIPPQQTRLIATALGRHSGNANLFDDSVYQLTSLYTEELEQETTVSRLQIFSSGGFSLKLTNSKNVLIDQIGTLSDGGEKKAWELPKSLIEGNRSSLMRRFDAGVPRSGIERRGWYRAFNAKRLVAGILLR